MPNILSKDDCCRIISRSAEECLEEGKYKEAVSMVVELSKLCGYYKEAPPPDSEDVLSRILAAAFRSQKPIVNSTASMLPSSCPAEAENTVLSVPRNQA